MTYNNLGDTASTVIFMITTCKEGVLSTDLCGVDSSQPRYKKHWTKPLKLVVIWNFKHTHTHTHTHLLHTHPPNQALYSNFKPTWWGMLFPHKTKRHDRPAVSIDSLSAPNSAEMFVSLLVFHILHLKHPHISPAPHLEPPSLHSALSGPYPGDVCNSVRNTGGNFGAGDITYTKSVETHEASPGVLAGLQT